MLKYESLSEWRQWRARREGPLRGRFFSPFSPKSLGIYSSASTAPGVRQVIVALEHLSPTQVASLLRPEAILRSREVSVIVIAPLSISDGLARHGLLLKERIAPEDPWRQLIPGAVLATSHSSGAGEFAWHLAEKFRVPYFVVQHGVVTPFAPPLPDNAHLLAWSDEDARFWTSRRRDVATTVVGSQIIWDAGQSKSDSSGSTDSVCFLGQLHGPELARSVTTRTVSSLSARGPMTYRPHPGEVDVVSRLVHRWWRQRRIPIESPTLTLAHTSGPVAGIFSTGILEAAASGRAAFSFCVRPPEWLLEFWDRYRMEPLDGACSTRVNLPLVEPARVIADVVDTPR